MNPKWTKLKLEIQEAYKAGGEKGLRKFIIKERLRIYANDLEASEEFNLIIMDVYELILNNIKFKDWHRQDLHEEDFDSYWKGESCCLATKFERQLNEYEYGDLSTGVYGRKIYLIFKGSILDERSLELSSVEIKPPSVSEDVEEIQLNKNIRVNKSILHNIVTHTGMGERDDNCHVLGMDIVGFSAFIYSVHQFEDSIVAVKLEEDNMFLPGDVDDLEDLVLGNTLDQLLNYKVFMVKLHDDINKATRKYKKLRLSSKTSGSNNPRLESPPRTTYPFPSSTFYTPQIPKKSV